MRVLLVEDEAEVAEFVMRGLKRERFSVDWAQTADKALMWAKVNQYDCAVMDIKLAGDVTGLDIVKAAREKKQAFPIIILSGIRDATTRVEALNLGADDYLIKPFLFAELLARIRALLRRRKAVTGPVITVGDIVLDTVAHTVMRNGKSIPMNRKEFCLLEYFMHHPRILLTRSMILDHVWDVTTDQLTNTVDVHIRFLRKKLGDGGKHEIIKTVHGYGYKLDI